MRIFRVDVANKDLDKIKKTVEVLLSDPDNELMAADISRLLLSADPDCMKEAFMLSILCGSRPLVEFIAQLFVDFPEEERAGLSNSDVFPPYMTPLMLACICNNYAIVECLLLRDHRMVLPHRTECLCKECDRVSNCIIGSNQRLDSYRALSSEAFLWMATNDPVLAAIDLVSELGDCQSEDPEHKEVYASFQTRVENFTGEIIQQCRSIEEVELLLEQREGVPMSEADNPFPRLRLALDGQVKPMLSHMNVQIALTARWRGAWIEGRSSVSRTFGRILRHTLFYPFLAFLHAFSAGLMVNSFHIPYARYLSYATSYATFVACLAFIRFGDKHSHGNILHITVESYVLSYVLGLIVKAFLEFAQRGASVYFELWWRWFDFVLLYVFVVAYICRSAAVFSPMPANLSRKHWVPYDPALLYEIFFGMACLLSFWRVFYFLQLHRTLGSTVISIGRCVSQVFNYFVILFVIVFAFTLGMTTILGPYTGAREVEDVSFRNKKMEDTFNTVFRGMKSLLWGFFGQMSSSSYDVVVGHSGRYAKSNEHYVTKYAAEGLIVLYYLVTVITLLNLMISLLVKKGDEVLENEDVEWKYTRVHIYMEYFKDTSAVPPPFNLVLIVFLWVRMTFSKKNVFLWPDLIVSHKIVEDNKQIEHDHSYRLLLVKLFHRLRANKFNHYQTIQYLTANYVKRKKPSPPPICLSERL
uniref:ANK_REP_REGION domain-containing protein n=1 Tax=Panagrellus redivivus TaxID=6233 RepID=A0A7E4VG99_PANRE